MDKVAFASTHKRLLAGLVMAAAAALALLAQPN